MTKTTAMTMNSPNGTEPIRLRSIVRRSLADTVTPVAAFLKLRDHYTCPVLLENNNFGSLEDCRSFIGLDVMASFKVENGQINMQLPDGKTNAVPIQNIEDVPEQLHRFMSRFQPEYETPFTGFNGLIGYTGFDGVQHFDTLRFDPAKRKMRVPELCYHLYRFVIAFHHFNDEIFIIENLLPGQESELKRLETLLWSRKISTHSFRLDGEEQSNLSDAEFKELVALGKHHCRIGDVFQIVFSRQFSRGFRGDDFNVYRVLRSVNPSPYLFYADFGSFRIFGSSPETQMAVADGVAKVNPIAGTYRRSGDPVEDAQKAIDLAADVKENAEHIMLVDLARNDLGRHAVNVRVRDLKHIHFYSHVIHLVSKVEGDLPEGANPVQIFADTFPAGTLSGAPKYKAMELIDRYENQNRGVYGGAIGLMDFNGNMNKAIIIRSFFSQNNTLYYQAGAGVVAASNEESELQEVNNKLGALKKALLEAERVG